ncbi:hypothetical protein [Mucilaginibacter gilvus]|uniref:Uncharacterized protein n=1 Tax=Mucilaginibacter gilvus TaxID=2305909 RepID=A0A444MJT2_9SPHI|nr:hypothetical protein [Mucilaginibacter gilvus]RWY49125.1 hypothetical protein EPL05_17030 [Mucilaginibacter gilvus]
MSQQNQNLSATQLAAIDLMIAHMQENGQTQLGGVWEAIVNAAQNAAGSAWVGPLTGVGNLDDAAVVAAPAAAMMATTGVAGQTTSTTEDVAALVNKLNEGGLQPRLTLENLVKIRNQFTK